MTVRPRVGIRTRAGIRGRVTAVAVAIVAVTVIVTAVAVALMVYFSLRAGVDASLTARAASVAEQISAGSLPRVIPGPPEDTSLVEVLGPDGAIVAATDEIIGEKAFLAPPTTSSARVSTTTSSPLDNAIYRVRAQQVSLPQGDGWILVASSLEPARSATETVVLALAVTLPVVLAVAGVVVWRSVGKALAPIHRMTQRAAAIGAHDLSARIVVPETHDEVGDLAVALNAMLDRLEDSAERLAQFTDDASHELRGPLASMRAEVDVTLAHPEAIDAALALRAVSAQIDRISQLAEDLLVLARSAAPPSQALVDLDDLVRAEAHRLRAAGVASVSVRLEDAARVHGSARDLARVLRNLGDNAARYATTAVDLRVTSDVDAVVTVRDDGPGVPAADRERIFDRFVRLEPSRSADEGGFGLGLSIARRVTEAHGGTLTAGRRADGLPGAQFELRLPLATLGS